MSNRSGTQSSREMPAFHLGAAVAAIVLLAVSLPNCAAQSTDGPALDQKALLLRVQDLERELAQIKSLL